MADESNGTSKEPFPLTLRRIVKEGVIWKVCGHPILNLVEGMYDIDKCFALYWHDLTRF